MIVWIRNTYINVLFLYYSQILLLLTIFSNAKCVSSYFDKKKYEHEFYPKHANKTSIMFWTHLMIMSVKVADTQTGWKRSFSRSRNYYYCTKVTSWGHQTLLHRYSILFYIVNSSAMCNTHSVDNKEQRTLKIIYPL